VAEKGDQERTEKPTGKKLSKAREEGQGRRDRSQRVRRSPLPSSYLGL